MSVVNEKKNKLVKKLVVPTVALGIFGVGVFTSFNEVKAAPRRMAWVMTAQETYINGSYRRVTKYGREFAFTNSISSSFSYRERINGIHYGIIWYVDHYKVTVR
ncbi:hypothetical protein SAMN02745116_01808 [Pilibacter termitis]|uniref:Uncharacterized protein n=1 Tax=Pilibacter termitis TaxID=263852 RepID=A0A1T4PJF6_9ENTE|nr:hypothetical protein [Pilibacter termitis]SJZ91336.1 hypothetical protein SAMN02745116_01808 [Pilibacter termitis]